MLNYISGLAQWLTRSVILANVDYRLGVYKPTCSVGVDR